MTMHPIRAVVAAAWVALAGPVASQVQPVAAVAGQGLTAPSERTPWPQLQWRVMPTVQTTRLWPVTPDVAPGAGLLGPALVADWYLGTGAIGPGVVGGFRATSGLLARPADGGLRLRTGESSATTLPYLGVGYSGLHRSTGWEVAADLGLVATTPGAVRLGRSTSPGPAIDDLVRDLRLAPVLRLQISYAF